MIYSECDFGKKLLKLNSVNKFENTVFGRQAFSIEDLAVNGANIFGDNSLLFYDNGQM